MLFAALVRNGIDQPTTLREILCALGFAATVAIAAAVIAHSRRAA